MANNNLLSWPGLFKWVAATAKISAYAAVV